MQGASALARAPVITTGHDKAQSVLQICVPRYAVSADMWDTCLHMNSICGTYHKYLEKYVLYMPDHNIKHEHACDITGGLSAELRSERRTKNMFE